MKIQLDTITKTIKIEESILLGEFIDKIKLILPKKEWRQFTIVPEILSNWINPIIIPWTIPAVPYYPYTPPVYPYYPWITCETSKTTYADRQISSGTSIDYKPGIYNIEIQ